MKDQKITKKDPKITNLKFKTVRGHLTVTIEECLLLGQISSTLEDLVNTAIEINSSEILESPLEIGTVPELIRMAKAFIDKEHIGTKDYIFNEDFDNFTVFDKSL
eukprot:Pgem_evm1s3097